MTMTDAIRDAIAEVTGCTDIADQDLLESGIIDSFGILQLITVMEARLEIRLDEDDLTAANFRTVESMAAMVAAKQAEE